MGDWVNTPNAAMLNKPFAFLLLGDTLPLPFLSPLICPICFIALVFTWHTDGFYCIALGPVKGDGLDN